MEWVRLGFEVASALGTVVITALARGDDTVLDMRVRDLLGDELKSVIAKRVADARAAEKFGA